MTDEISYGTVEQRLDACDRAILKQAAQHAELQNEMSLLASIQRTCTALDVRVSNLERQYDAVLKRLKALEDDGPELFGLGQPPLSVQTPQPFGSIDNLVQQVERMFNCKNGDYRAWHTVLADRNVETAGEYRYQCLVLIAPDSILEAQERLRQAMYTSFLKLKQTCQSERPVLYWRYAVEERIQEETDAYTTGPFGKRYKIRTRIAIPEADYSAVADMLTPDGDPIPIIVQ